MNQSHWTLDIEIYEEYGDHVWAQAKYLVHGYDDVFWTNNLDDAISFLKSSAQAIGNTEPKYEYHLHTRGGFYNEEHFRIHQKPRGDFWFNTAEARQQFIDELKAVEEKLDARSLAMTLSEGYCCRIPTVLHRVVEWENKRYYSKYDMGINYPFSAAKYHLEWKWTCGFNDYPLGRNFDYDTNQPKVIQEWITGAEQELEFKR